MLSFPIKIPFAFFSKIDWSFICASILKSSILFHLFVCVPKQHYILSSNFILNLNWGSESLSFLKLVILNILHVQISFRIDLFLQNNLQESIYKFRENNNVGQSDTQMGYISWFISKPVVTTAQCMRPYVAFNLFSAARYKPLRATIHYYNTMNSPWLTLN